MDTSELEELLGGGGTNKTRSSGGRDNSDSDGSALSSGLAGNGMGGTDLVSPVTSSDGNDVLLGDLESFLDGNLDLLGDLNTNSNVTISVSDGDDGLESGSLTGLSLLLDGHDLHDFVRKILKEVLSDLVLLDGERVGEDLLDGLDLSGLY